MARHRDSIDANRLLDASDAVLAAVREVAPSFQGRSPYPPALMGTPMQPAALRGYSRYEVEEATRMLLRLGLLDPT